MFIIILGGPKSPQKPLPGARNRPLGPRSEGPEPSRMIPGSAKLRQEMKNESKRQVRHIFGDQHGAGSWPAPMDPGPELPRHGTGSWSAPMDPAPPGPIGRHALRQSKLPPGPAARFRARIRAFGARFRARFRLSGARFRFPRARGPISRLWGPICVGAPGRSGAQA